MPHHLPGCNAHKMRWSEPIALCAAWPTSARPASAFLKGGKTAPPLPAQAAGPRNKTVLAQLAAWAVRAIMGCGFARPFYLVDMLLRQEDDCIVAVSQPAHAWVAGQLAYAWGNDDFEAPCEEVCLAAQLHDIGFQAWEQKPTWNVATGLPHTFLEMPAGIQLPLWTGGIREVMQYGRYSALLVSLHFSALARRIEKDRGGEDAMLASKFISLQEEFRTTIATSLRNDFYYGPRSAEEDVHRDQEFVSFVDWISLQILLRFKDPKVAREQQARGLAANFELVPLNTAGTEICLDPWPFKGTELGLVCDGRRLLSTFIDEEAMREGLRAAAPVTLPLKLRKAG